LNLFDQAYDRTGTSEKYDLREQLFGRVDVTPMWVADTDFAVPGCVQRALSDRINHPLYGYQEPRPERTLAAIQWWLESQHRITVSTDDILLSPSVVTSMGVAIDAFTNEGEGVGFFTPVYPPFFKMAAYNKRRGVEIPLIKEGARYRIDFDALREALPRMKLLIFAHPHNPSGRVWSVDDLKRLLTMCRGAGVKIFSDEIHSDLVYEPHQHHPFLNLPDAEDTILMAHSIGKTFNCAGLRASYVVIPSSNMRDRFFNSQKKTHTDEISCLGKVALAAALTKEGVGYRRTLLEYLSGNISLANEMLSQGLPMVDVMVPESTFLVWVDFSAIPLSAKALRDRLIDVARVGFSPGHAYGEPGKGYYRINVGLQRPKLREALERVVSVLDDVAK
jgi:cystathionine beta-lyase